MSSCAMMALLSLAAETWQSVHLGLGRADRVRHVRAERVPGIALGRDRLLLDVDRTRGSGSAS